MSGLFLRIRFTLSYHHYVAELRENIYLLPERLTF